MNGVASLFIAFLKHPEFHRVIVWWLTWAGLGLAFLPLTMRLFKGFHDRGYAFARVLGLLLPALCVWLLSSLGIAPFNRTTALLSVACGALINYSFPGSSTNVRRFFRERRAHIVAQEYLFVLALLAWAFIRSMNPDIENLEKFMDFGFVNASLRAEWMPPADMWFSGETINYYYFGHYFTAFFSALNAVPADIAYNLMIASLFALAVALPYSIVSNMLRHAFSSGGGKAVVGGALAALLLALGGNLHPVVYGVVPQALHRAGLAEEAPSYWYTNATRFIGYNPDTNDKTIHEFPLYSFVVADLHGHVLDIPVVLSLVGIGASALMVSSPGEMVHAPFRPPLAEAAAAGVLLAVAWMTNSWDYPIYLFILFGVFLVRALARRRSAARAFGEFLLPSAALLAVSQVLILPYNRNFQNFTGGVHRTMANSPLWQLAILWGHQLFFAASFALFLAFAARRILAERNGEGRLRALLLRTPPPDIMALGMAAAALCLLIVPELVYVKDIYGATYHRANTMFKMTYQASILFALVAGYAMPRIVGGLRGCPKSRLAASLLFGLAAAMPLTYPFFAVPGFYAPPPLRAYKWLHGLEFLNESDRAIVRWFGSNVRGRPVLLEANGDSYTRSGRISMATGLPAPLGWYVHEWLWRGGTDELNRRSADIAAIYASDDADAARRLVERYAIRYIVVGELEREKFKKIETEKLMELGSVVFRMADGSFIVETDIRQPSTGPKEKK